jgi:anti-sigma regulatory factor (Ser/Thr protein kinase)
MARTIEFRIPSDPQMLKIVRDGVSHVCVMMGFRRGERNNIVLAVDEACSNIIKHAYKGETDKPIIIILKMDPDKLEINLRDYGEKVNIKAIKSRKLDDIRPGGLGVHLIKSVMDEVTYEDGPDLGNRLHLVKYVKKKVKN